MKGFIFIIGHIKITRTRRRVALFDERIYIHVIGHIKITRTRRRAWHCLMKGFICILDILR